ncbi:MAG: hypothetical protein EAZ58_12190 [Flavobacterium sp.]|nr:MAG: hypothetical protein EAZ58_12190 [Flavobacterium sp.]
MREILQLVKEFKYLYLEFDWYASESNETKPMTAFKSILEDYDIAQKCTTHNYPKANPNGEIKLDVRLYEVKDN